MNCTACGERAIYTTNAAVYGRNYGAWPRIWLCPACGCYVGTHKGTSKPLGTFADAATRKARKAAHAAFDPLWRNGSMSRTDAYAWLAEQMGIDVDKCHIGMFTEAQCNSAIEIVRNREPQP